MSKIAIRINKADVVAVALEPLSKGTQVTLEAMDDVPEVTVTLQEDITAGHKFAIKEIKKRRAGYQIRISNRFSHRRYCRRQACSHSQHSHFA